MKLLPNGIAIIETDSHVSKWIEQEGRLDHDQNMLPVILPYINEGDVVVDVGAFIGDHTIAYLNKVGPTGKVFAFEPNDEAFECLIHNCPTAINMNVGLSNKFEKLCFSYSVNAGASFFQPVEGLFSVIPLDSIHMTRLNFMKIDVEGMELNVLKGAAKTIKECRPIILMEINPGALQRWQTNPPELIAYLESLGYTHKKVYGHEQLTDLQFDLLFIPS
jgi:FkbM family methyltransferase